MLKMDPINYKEMRRIASLPIKGFAAYGKKYDTPDGPYFFKNNNSKILGVAHLDSVSPFTHFAKATLRSGTLLFYPTVDDRTGAFILLSYLKKMGINFDVLLTDGEEKGNSTAQHFPIKKKYNWMFSFDRMGTDLVMYSYRSSELVNAVQKHGFIVGQGSYSDIAALDELGCKGINIGTAYYNYHSPDAFVRQNEMLIQIRKFISFYNETKDYHFAHEVKHYYPAYGSNNYKKGESSFYKGASKSKNFGPSEDNVQAKKTTPIDVSKKYEEATAPLLGTYVKRTAELLSISDINFLKSWKVPYSWFEGKIAFIQHSDTEQLRSWVERISLQIKSFEVPVQDVHEALKKIVVQRINQPTEGLLNWFKEIGLYNNDLFSIRPRVDDMKIVRYYSKFYPKITGFMDHIREFFIELSTQNKTISSSELGKDVGQIVPSEEGNQINSQKTTQIVIEAIDNCSQCHHAFKTTLDNPESLCPKCIKENDSSKSKKTYRIEGVLPLFEFEGPQYGLLRDTNTGELYWGEETKPTRTTEPVTTRNEQEDPRQSLI